MLLNGKRIFIVDDNAADVSLMQTILNQAGVKTYFERRGKETHKIIKSSLPIDLILMDLVLWSGNDGHDLFEQIRAIPELADIPVIMVTSADAGQEMPLAQAKGFNGFINKPIRVNTFLRLIGEFFDKGEVWAPQR